MKSSTCQIILVVLLVTNNMAYSNQSDILWNEDCPAAVLGTKKEHQALKNEFPEHTKWFGQFLDWQDGVKITEPNEELQKDILSAEKVFKEVLKSSIPPIESIKDHFMLITVDQSNRKERMLQFRIKTSKYIIKYLERKYNIVVIVRPISGETINIIELASDIFNKRILPMKWEEPFYTDKMKVDSKVLKSSYWDTRDKMRINNNGKPYTIDGLSTLPIPEIIPLGKGLYGEVITYSDDKFAMFIVNSGPRILTKDVPGYPGSAGTGDK